MEDVVLSGSATRRSTECHVSVCVLHVTWHALSVVLRAMWHALVVVRVCGSSSVQCVTRGVLYMGGLEVTHGLFIQ